MKLDYQKELTPVLYGDSAVKVIYHSYIEPHRFGFTTHWHDRMELLIIHSGSLEVTCGGSSAEATPDEVVIFPPVMPHSGVAGDEGVCYTAVMFDVSKFFNSTGISERFLAPLHGQSLSFELISKNPEIAESLKEIIKQNDLSDPVADVLTVGEIYRLVGLLLKHCRDDSQTAVTEGGRFKEVLDFINVSFCEEISTAELSRRFGYDEAYFCRKFKKITGLTPMIYIRILRLEKAKKLMKQGQTSISAVATACGFSDAGYFSRCFKKHFGIAPNEYAAKYKR